MHVDDDQTVYVADHNNHRIIEWKNGATSGRVVAGGNGQGNRTDQLNGPTDVISDKKSNTLIICDYGNKRVMRWPRHDSSIGEIIIPNIDCYGLCMNDNGYLYVSEYNTDEVKRWRIGEKSGTVVAGGHGKGNRLDQLNGATHLFIDHNGALYIVDQGNHRVVKWTADAQEGSVVAGGRGQGSSLEQLSSPVDVLVDQSDGVYVADYNNHRVVRWSAGATQGSVIVGGNGSGLQANQLNGPVGLAFDRQNNLYVADLSNHRVQKFDISSSPNT